MSEPFVPTTASNFQERWVIVCVNPANSDDKMEFASVVELNAELFRLKAEVERLRKAGDEVIHEWSSGHGTDVENFTKALWVWAVAKEGKPSV